MLSKAVAFSKYTIPIILKDTACFYIYAHSGFKRHFHGRTFIHQDSSINEIDAFSGDVIKTSETEPDKITPEESAVIQSQLHEFVVKDVLDMANQSPYGNLVKESGKIYSKFSGNAEQENASVSKDNVSAMSFEDEFFKMRDEASSRFLEDDVDDSFELANQDNPDESVVYMKQGESEEFFDRILRVDENEILSEREKKNVSIIREEKKEEKKEIKRSSWFNFMPAKEKPEGMHGTYSNDQIYSSLVFDLLSRNAEEVYKYEKDDLFVNEEIIKHTKLPEDIEPPKIPLYPNFEEYAKWVTFAVNRNSHYSMEEKKKVVDILTRLGSLDSEMDESPKTEFKEKKYL